MAAAILDVDINEGETFLMSIEFWEDSDNTIPVDITRDTFTGAMQIGQKYIPIDMSFGSLTVNVLNMEIPYGTMVDLAKTGKYDVEQQQGDEKFRLIQGRIRVNKEVTI